MTITLLRERLTDITRELRTLVAQPTSWTPQQRARVEKLHFELTELQTEEPDAVYNRAFRNYLLFGPRLSAPDFAMLQQRGLDSLGGAYPGSPGGPFAPVQFVNAAFAMLKQADRLFDPDVVTFVETDKGGPAGIPNFDDTSVSATKVTQGSESSNADLAYIGQLSFATAATWRSGVVLASLALIQDVGASLQAVGYSATEIAVLQQQQTGLGPLERILAHAFAARFQRGIGADNVTTLLSSAALGTTATGSASNTGGSETGATTIGTDDLYNLISSVDSAYVTSPKCYWAMRLSTLIALWKLIDKQGHPIIPATFNERGEPTLLGRPVAICPSMPAIGTGNKPIAFGDFSRFIVRTVKNGFRVQVYSERWAEYGKSGFEAFMRADAGLQRTATVVSPPSFSESPIKYLQNA